MKHGRATDSTTMAYNSLRFFHVFHREIGEKCRESAGFLQETGPEQRFNATGTIGIESDDFSVWNLVGRFLTKFRSRFKVCVCMQTKNAARNVFDINKRVPTLSENLMRYSVKSRPATRRTAICRVQLEWMDVVCDEQH